MNDIDIWPYTLQLKTPWKTGWTNVRTRQGFIVQIGKSHGDAAALPGAPASELRRINAALRRPASTGPRQPTGAARNALLQAALAEKAREQGFSLGAFLGEPYNRSPHTKVLTNATIPIMTIAKTVRRANEFVRRGCKTVKLKVGPAANEWKRVEAVRDAVGPRIHLRLDPNGSWNAKTLQSRLERVEPLDIQYVEQPFTPRNPKTFLEAAARSPIPLAPDEATKDLASIRTLLEDQVLEYVVLKPMVLGGPDIALEAVMVVEDASATPIVTDVVESGVGRAGALHVASLTRNESTAHGLASGLQLRNDITDPALLPERGALHVPRRPGLGVRARRPT